MEDGGGGSERRTKRGVEAREAAVNEHTEPVCTGGQLLLLSPLPPFSPRERILLASPCPQHTRYYSVHAVRERVHLRSLIAISR